MTTTTDERTPETSGQIAPVVGMTLYGLTAKCRMIHDGGVVWWPSKMLFTTREAAEAELPEFTERLMQPTENETDRVLNVMKHNIHEYVFAG